jgi:hypothetical protein
MKKSIIYGTLFALTAGLALPAAGWARRGGPMKDTNGDGVVTLDEAKASAERRFDHKDTNGDGVITKDEVLAKVQARFNEIDADGNGQVTREEKQAARASHRHGQ